MPEYTVYIVHQCGNSLFITWINAGIDCLQRPSMSKTVAKQWKLRFFLQSVATSVDHQLTISSAQVSVIKQTRRPRWGPRRVIAVVSRWLRTSVRWTVVSRVCEKYAYQGRKTEKNTFITVAKQWKLRLSKSRNSEKYVYHNRKTVKITVYTM